MTVEEALVVLKKAKVTDSVQTLRRWLREGKIQSQFKSKKEGYEIDEVDLNRFIDERTGRDKVKKIKSLETKLAQKERNKLTQDNHKLQMEVDKLRSDNLHLKFKLLSKPETETVIVYKSDHRSILGLDDTATDEEVRSTYRKLIKLLHPDKGGDSKLFQKFKEDYDNFQNSIKVNVT